MEGSIYISRRQKKRDNKKAPVAAKLAPTKQDIISSNIKVFVLVLDARVKLMETVDITPAKNNNVQIACERRSKKAG